MAVSKPPGLWQPTGYNGNWLVAADWLAVHLGNRTTFGQVQNAGPFWGKPSSKPGFETEFKTEFRNRV